VFLVDISSKCVFCFHCNGHSLVSTVVFFFQSVPSLKNVLITAKLWRSQFPILTNRSRVWPVIHFHHHRERVMVNPDNSRAMGTLTFLLFKLNKLHNETLHWNHYMWVRRNLGVMTVVCWIYTTIMASRWLFRHKPVSHGTNKPIIKSEFAQCMKAK